MDDHGAFNYGALYGHYSITSSELFRNPDGTFSRLIGEFQRLNVQLATELQQEVARALRQSLIRPRVSTGMLERVILDARNRDAGTTADVANRAGFGVGIPEFLDESAAKYWQQIEEGSTAHLGQRMRGLWANSISYQGADYTRGAQTSQRALQGKLYGFGDGVGQGFRPFTRKQLASAVNRRKRDNKPFRVRGVIKVPIEPHHYFQGGWETWGGIDTVKKRYGDLLRRHGIQAIWHDGRYTRKAIGGGR